MKSITTCPSCQTQFLVTDEQLSQYNGKVRCGHCLNVFNAVDYIVVQPSENQQTEIVTEQILVKDSEPAKLEESVAANTFNDPAIHNQHSESNFSVVDALARENFEQAILPSEKIVAVSDSEEPLAFEPESSQHETNISNLTRADAKSDIKRADVLNEIFSQAELPLEDIVEPKIALEGSSSPLENSLIETELSSEAYQEEVSKINEFDYKPEYQYFLEEKKATSPLLVTLGGLFILLALFQGVYFYRNAIAMHYPETKPYLVNICKFIGCKINLPQEIQLFSIDDSTIAEDNDHQGVIRLSSTITNRADFNQAYPNLEVTLTDTQDKPTLRRIFKPNEYLTKAYRLDEGIASGDSIEIDMPLMADDFKPAGFRLLVSY